MVSALGLSGVAMWTSWKMQQILILTHKQNIQYISDRLPHDVEIYSEMVSLTQGMQKVIDNLTTNHTLLWIKRPDGTVAAQSMPMKMKMEGTGLLSLKEVPTMPELQSVKGRYWLVCANPLVVKNTNLGTVYIAQDITVDQMMFWGLMRSLSLASFLAISGMTLVIAWYVRRSLYPLQRMSQLTANVSAERLGEAQLHLENAPSEVRELAQMFDQMLMRLSQSWEHQRQLVSNVSHELRTPLTIVSGYLQSILRRGHNLTDVQREALEIAASETERTIQLMEDLLDLARADSGRMHFQIEPIMVNELVAEVAGMAKKYSSDRHLEIALTDYPITIKADSNRLKQVLLNLIDNAVKYSDPEMPITLKLIQKDKLAMIQVCDRGVGIPLQQQARIFERFYRLDETRCRATGGIGLGLS
ncbi:MAG: sensor histidine kinase, partial [Microcystaceae cyanobacterium]